MLAFLFLRYLSDNYEVAAKKELGKDYPAPGSVENGGKTPLSVWYEENGGDIMAFEKQMRRKAHYVIQPQQFWTNIAYLAETQSDDILKTVGEAQCVSEGIGPAVPTVGWPRLTKCVTAQRGVRRPAKSPPASSHQLILQNQHLINQNQHLILSDQRSIRQTGRLIRQNQRFMRSNEAFIRSNEGFI